MTIFTILTYAVLFLIVGAGASTVVREMSPGLLSAKRAPLVPARRATVRGRA